MTATLTGATRYRSQRRWGGREEMVLQVEETGSEMQLIGGWPSREDFTRWRDARTTDFTSFPRDPSETGT